MLNAYNNDIEYKSKWYHIQTEDNGLKNGHITTTVFHSGQTLDCKSTSYQDAVSGLTDEAEINKVVKERMVEQHQFFYKKLFEGDYDAKVAAMYAKSSLPKSASVPPPGSTNGPSVGPVSPVAPITPARGGAQSVRSLSPVIAKPKMPADPNHVAVLTKPVDCSNAVKASRLKPRRVAYAGVVWPKDDLSLDSLVAVLIEGGAV